MLQDSPGVDYMPHHISGRAPPRAVCTQFDLDQCGNGSSEPNLLPTAMEDEMVDANARHDRQLRLHGRQMWREAGRRGARTNTSSGARVQVQRPPEGRVVANPMVAHPEPSATEEPVEEAELLENLGEFPGRTDQGDRMPAPMTKRRAREYLRRG